MGECRILGGKMWWANFLTRMKFFRNFESLAFELILGFELEANASTSVHGEVIEPFRFKQAEFSRMTFRISNRNFFSRVRPTRSKGITTSA